VFEPSVLKEDVARGLFVAACPWASARQYVWMLATPQRWLQFTLYRARNHVERVRICQSVCSQSLGSKKALRNRLLSWYRISFKSSVDTLFFVAMVAFASLLTTHLLRAFFFCPCLRSIHLT